ncbi:hypothetical protein Ciccas_011921 [Cichlidogyrus casuarinus]|uniref:Hexosyltransferase n=1 Tax=Cichlidogyrus casuarinus TaxID=1844966 RepID=A0ABD2PRL5_9PLAT
MTTEEVSLQVKYLALAEDTFLSRSKLGGGNAPRDKGLATLSALCLLRLLLSVPAQTTTTTTTSRPMTTQMPRLELENNVCERETSLVAVVWSRAENRQQRRKIRNSWGALRYVVVPNNQSRELIHGVETHFLIGGNSDQLLEEQSLNGDLLRYNSSASLLRHLLHSCQKRRPMLALFHDWVFVNVPKLLSTRYDSILCALENKVRCRPQVAGVAAPFDTWTRLLARNHSLTPESHLDTGGDGQELLADRELHKNYLTGSQTTDTSKLVYLEEVPMPEWTY